MSRKILQSKFNYVLGIGFVLGITSIFHPNADKGLFIGLILLFSYLTYAYVVLNKKMVRPMLLVFLIFYFFVNVDAVLPYGIDFGNDRFGSVLTVVSLLGVILAVIISFYIYSKENNRKL